MKRIYQVTDHPVLTGVKREVLYQTLIDKPLEEYIKVLFILKHYKLVGTDKVPIKGLEDKEESITASNKNYVDSTGNIVVPTLDSSGNPILTGLTKQYDYFMATFDITSPPNIYTTIQYYINKDFTAGLFD
jgi:hypothetical protein